MHDIWNPWHGCRKCSEGCQHCYMFFLDRMRDKNGGEIYRQRAASITLYRKTVAGDTKYKAAS